MVLEVGPGLDKVVLVELIPNPRVNIPSKPPIVVSSPGRTSPGPF
jgi:hypothetical protein